MVAIGENEYLYETNTNITKVTMKSTKNNQLKAVTKSYMYIPKAQLVNELHNAGSYSSFSNCGDVGVRAE